MRNNVMHPEKQTTGNTAWSTGSDAWTGAPKSSDESSQLSSRASDILESARGVVKSAFDVVAARPIIAALSVVGLGAAIFAATRFAATPVLASKKKKLH